MDNNTENIIVPVARQDAIHEKGFDMGQTQFGKIKVGVKTLDDAVLNLGEIRSASKIALIKQLSLRR